MTTHHTDDAELAAVMRTLLADEDIYVDADTDDVCIDGWVHVTDTQLATIRRHLELRP